MKSFTSAGVLALVALGGAAASAQAGSNPFFLQGSFNGYAFDTPMTQIDAVKWSKTITMAAGTRQNGLAATAGYAQQAPPGFADARWEVPASGSLTFNLFNSTSWSDGWEPSAERRFGISGTTNSWEVMGGWNGFTAGTLLSSMGGDVYQTTMFLTAGNYDFKFRYAGDWDINYGNHTLGNNQGNLNVVVGADSNVTFQLDMANGRMRALVPAPGAVALLGLGGLAAVRRRRR